VKIDVRCGFGGGKPCGNKVGTIPPDDLDFAHGVVTFDRLRREERHYVCPDHGALQVYDEDLLRLALKPRKRYSIMATSVPG
jgi:hypothetical protein